MESFKPTRKAQQYQDTTSQATLARSRCVGVVRLGKRAHGHRRRLTHRQAKAPIPSRTSSHLGMTDLLTSRATSPRRRISYLLQSRWRRDDGLRTLAKARLGHASSAHCYAQNSSSSRRTAAYDFTVIVLRRYEGKNDRVCETMARIPAGLVLNWCARGHRKLSPRSFPA